MSIFDQLGVKLDESKKPMPKSRVREPGQRYSRTAKRATRKATPTDFRFVVTYNSGKQQRMLIRAMSAQQAIEILREGCCGLIRFQMCQQTGTQYA